MRKTYTLEVAGLTRELPIVAISEELSIASFVILGDTQLVVAAAKELKPKVPQVDWLITAEAKGIPLVFELSRVLEMEHYIVARKSIKSYMVDPLVHEVESITTQNKQMLCLDGEDAKLLKNKRVAIVDDVISTGASVGALQSLVEKAGGEVVAKVTILVEGDAMDREDVIYLEKLPLFENK